MDQQSNWTILYTDAIPIYIGDHLSTKEITVKETKEVELKKLLVEISTKHDPFDTYHVVINEVDFEIKYQQRQNIKANFQEFCLLLIELFKKLKDPQQKYEAYLQTVTTIKSNLSISLATPLKNANQIEIELFKVTNEQLKDLVHSEIDKLKTKLEESEEKVKDLSRKLQESEAKNSLKEMNLQDEHMKTISSQEQKIAYLDKRYSQELEELDRDNLKRFNNYQTEIKDEMRSMKLTNSSLQVLIRTLEANNCSIEKKLREENKQLRSANKAREQMDKDIKILQEKITRCNEELKDSYAEVNYYKNRNKKLKKNFDEKLAHSESSNAYFEQRCISTVRSCKESCIKLVKKNSKVALDGLALLKEKAEDLLKQENENIARFRHSATVSATRYAENLKAITEENAILLCKIANLQKELIMRPVPSQAPENNNPVERNKPCSSKSGCRPTVKDYLQTKFWDEADKK